MIVRGSRPQLGVGRGFGGNQRSTYPRKHIPLILASSSKGSDDSKKGKGSNDKDPDPRKADFSAYWSLKIKEFFDNRRKFLEEVDRKGIPESKFVRKLENQAELKLEELMKLEAEERQLRETKLKAKQELEALSASDTEKQLRAGNAVPVPSDIADQFIVEDIERAKADLRSATVSGAPVNMYRARALIRTVLMFPINLAVAIMKWWSDLYTSQSYENFLMSEGERIWYWRNRTENERWFWEIAFWDRLALPILCTVAYELLVPNNFIWAVIVPLTFIVIQSGELPSWRGIEFWLIAYFGFYLKCWPDVLPLIKGILFMA